MYASNYYKNWLIPFVSVFVVFMIVNAYELSINNKFFQFSNATLNLKFKSVYELKNILVTSFFTIILLVSLVFLPARLRQKRKKINGLIL